MPRAIADSDDEDEIFAVEDGNKAPGEGLPTGSHIANGEGAVGGLDGTNERSTGSTERLRRDLQSAECGLMTNSAPVAMNAPSSGTSPAVQTNKRRQTTAFGSYSAATSPQKKAKRTKTLKTYGAGSSGNGIRQQYVDEDANFEQLKADDPVTSQSIRFSEHSGVRSSAELPAHAEDFLNHEPAVMFRDSESTIPDDSSAQQRLLAQALGSGKAVSGSMRKEGESEGQKSSPFPWSADCSEATQKAKAATNADAEKEGGAENGGTAGDSGNADVHGPESEKQGAFTDGNASNQHRSQTPKGDAAQSKPASYPPKQHQNVVVQIPVQPPPAPSPPANAPTSTQKASKGRKRKATVNEQQSDPLNSDDKAIGLPKERYQPRPSRRRATQIAEEEIDYSVRPEKAAKIKRTNPTHAGNGFPTQTQDSAAPAFDDGSVAKKTVDDHPKNDSATRAVQTGSHLTASQQVEGKAAETPSTQHTNDTSPTPKQKNDDEIFVKPAKPTPKPKSASRAKRSHTTIFEDHVEFLGSQRSPSLSQQQAQRKSESALQNVQNEAKPTQRKRKTVVSDDEDDQEASELAEVPSEEEDSPPKKRGKGRTPKAKAKPQAKSAAKVASDSEEDVDEPVEAEEAPKKRGRGDAAKAASTQVDKTVDTASKEDPSPVETDEPQSRPVKIDDKPAEDLAIADTGTQGTKSSASELPTPSPEKATEQPAPTRRKDTKSSPTSHSPIKSSSGVPLRVGLSKRHRIPSLLRTMNPPKRKDC